MDMVQGAPEGPAGSISHHKTPALPFNMCHSHTHVMSEEAEDGVNARMDMVQGATEDPAGHFSLGPLWHLHANVISDSVLMYACTYAYAQCVPAFDVKMRIKRDDDAAEAGPVTSIATLWIGPPACARRANHRSEGRFHRSCSHNQSTTLALLVWLRA